MSPTPIVNATTFPVMNNFKDISSVVNLITPLLSTGAAILFLGMLFYAGYVILTAGGSAENYQKAQKIATFAVIGLLIVVLAYVIVRLLSYLLGVQSLI